MKRLVECLYYKGKFGKVRWRNGPIPNPAGDGAYFQCFGLLFNWNALWVGAHYSKRDKRLCINLVPCLTLWWAKPGGVLP